LGAGLAGGALDGFAEDGVDEVVVPYGLSPARRRGDMLEVEKEALG
jgi:hypothetical protein